MPRRPRLPRPRRGRSSRFWQLFGPALVLGLGVAFGLVVSFATLLIAGSARAEGESAPGPSVSASSKPAAGGAFARIRDQNVFAVKTARNGHSAADRAAHATHVLEQAVEAPTEGVVHVDAEGDVAVLYIADAPVIQLGPEDAAADGDASAAVHAAVVAARVTDAVHAERRRSALATTVFSASLLVFSGLIAFLALGKLGGLVTRGRDWVASRPSSLPNVRIAGIDIVQPTALRGVALGTLDASKWVLRIGLAYAWLLFALSLFDVTRAYSQRLTGFVLAPLSGLVSRIAVTMPVLFIGGLATLALLLLLRVVALFFEGVTRGEPALSWLPADLAAPTSILIRIGAVLVAVSVATPLITGNEDGPLARASLVALGAVALAVVPILASSAVGVAVLFSRRIKVGDFVEVGGRAGVVRGLTLLGVSLEDREGCQVRVPHLVALTQPTRVLGALPPCTVEIAVTSAADVATVTALLARAAEGIGIRGRVELTQLDAGAAVYLVTALSASATAKSELLTAIASGLKEAAIPLGAAERSSAPDVRRVSSLPVFLGLLLLAYIGSFLVGERRIRGFGLPSGAEYIVLGFLLGPGVFGLLDHATLRTFDPIADVAVGWIALVIGLGFGVDRRRRTRPGHLALAAVVSLFTAVAVAVPLFFAVTHWTELRGQERLFVVAGGALVSAETTRESVRWVAERYGARGYLSSIVSDLARSDDVVPILAVAIVFSLAAKAHLPWPMHPVSWTGLTIGIGVVFGGTAALIIGRDLHTDETWGTLLGISVLGVGITTRLGLSTVTAMFAMGLATALFSGHRQALLAMVEPTERTVLHPVLLLAGARIELATRALPLILIAAILARTAAKTVVGGVWQMASEPARRAGPFLGMGLLSAGTLSMTLGLAFALRFPGAVGDYVLAIATAATIFGEFVGPFALRAALRRAGEIEATETLPPGAPVDRTTRAEVG